MLLASIFCSIVLVLNISVSDLVLGFRASVASLSFIANQLDVEMVRLFPLQTLVTAVFVLRCCLRSWLRQLGRFSVLIIFLCFVADKVEVYTVCRLFLLKICVLVLFHYRVVDTDVVFKLLAVADGISGDHPVVIVLRPLCTS